MILGNTSITAIHKLVLTHWTKHGINWQYTNYCNLQTRKRTKRIKQIGQTIWSFIAQFYTTHGRIDYCSVQKMKMIEQLKQILLTNEI